MSNICGEAEVLPVFMPRERIKRPLKALLFAGYFTFWEKRHVNLYCPEGLGSSREEVDELANRFFARHIRSAKRRVAVVFAPEHAITLEIAMLSWLPLCRDMVVHTPSTLDGIGLRKVGFVLKNLQETCPHCRLSARPTEAAGDERDYWQVPGNVLCLPKAYARLNNGEPVEKIAGLNIEGVSLDLNLKNALLSPRKDDTSEISFIQLSFF